MRDVSDLRDVSDVSHVVGCDLMCDVSDAEM